MLSRLKIQMVYLPYTRMKRNFHVLLLPTWKLTSIIVAVYLTFSAVTGDTFQTGRVSNGNLAEYGEFPYLASIAENDAHYCGGFIYNDRFIVTSASCVDGKVKEHLKVYVGQFNLISPDSDEQDITVFSVVMFDGYNNKSKLHDIALLQTSRPMVFGPYVTFIKYANVNEDLTSSEFAGWGATQDGGLQSSKLRKINMTLPGNCSTYSTYQNDYMICAGNDIDDGAPCQYDEGAPLVQDNVVIGIMSNNNGCTAPFVSTIFTRLPAYESWLTKFAGAQ